MNLKKSLIIGASVLTLAPITSATFVGTQVQANETDTVSVSQNEDIDIQKLDAYVSFDKENLKYSVIPEAQNELNDDEYLFVTEKVSETNSQLGNIELANNETMQVDEKTVTVTQTVDSENTPASNVSLRAAFSEGVNKIESHWWGYRVWLSKSTVNSIGTGLTLGGVFIPGGVVKTAVSAAGVALGASPGGIVFNTSPQLATMVPGLAGHLLRVWGFRFQ